jgi:hypothetical protein
MEKPKPAQNHEQERPKTLEDYAVKTFPADLDVTIRPLTVIRSGKDGKGIRYDGGWIPGDILSVCDTDSEEGISPIELFVKVHKPVKVNGEYVIATKIVSLKKLQSREANKGFNESYIQDLYGKSTEEMATEGADAAGQVWRQKHPDSDWNELLDVKAPSETPSDSLDTEGNSEKSLKDEVSPAMGNLAVKTVEVSSVKTNEVSVNSPALVMTKEVMESIGAIKVNDSVGSPAVRTIGIKKPAVRAIGIKKPVETDKVGANPADLVATEPVKKPVEADRASADLVDLPAAKSVENPVVEKSMETNEANTDILPEDFKSVINNFEKYTGGDNGEFSAETKSIARELNELKWRIQRNPEAIKEPVTEELIRRASSRIRDLEVSRAKSANKFKNNIESLLEGLKSNIENDDERRRLIKLTEHVDQMGTDNRVLGDVTNGLLGKLTIIRSIIDNSRNDRWGIIAYRDRFVRVIEEIIGSDDYRDIDRKFSGDLGSIYRRRQSILDAIKGIREAGY